MYQISEFSSAKLVKGVESQSCYMVNLKLVATLIVKRALHDAPHTFHQPSSMVSARLTKCDVLLLLLMCQTGHLIFGG